VSEAETAAGLEGRISADRTGGGKMSVSGDWTLLYSWNGSPDYGSSAIRVQQDGTLLLHYDTGPAIYGGTVDGDAGSGASSTFEGVNGFWVLVKEGVTGLAIREADSARVLQHSHDVAGNKL
jgi:hypothetical protein